MTTEPMPTRHTAYVRGQTYGYYRLGPAVGHALVWVPGADGPKLPGGIALLARTRPVYIVELPVYGTDYSSAAPHAAELGRGVVALVRGLGHESFDLLGSSMGGVIALRAAIQAPDCVKRLVLEAPGAFRPEVDLSGVAFPELMVMLRTHPERKSETLEPVGRRLDWDFVEEIMGPRDDEELRGTASRCAVPTLVVLGLHDGLFGISGSSALEEIMPDARVVVVSDAAHEISGDQPEGFAAIVDRFLTSAG